MQDVRIAVVQMSCRVGESEANIARMEQFLNDAATGNVDLVCFPELSVQGYTAGDAAASTPEPISGPSTEALASIGRRLGITFMAGLLERDVENSYLASDAVDDDPMTPLLGHSITYRIAVGSQAGRKVFTLQTLPTSGDPFGDGIGKVAGFSLHAGVAARADERKKLERLCRYISRPAVSEKRLLRIRLLSIRFWRTLTSRLFLKQKTIL